MTFPNSVARGRAQGVEASDRGRAKPRTLVNGLVGSRLYRQGATNIEFQGGVLNLFDTTHVLNFLSIFNGTHYGPPRTWTARLKVSF